MLDCGVGEGIFFAGDKHVAIKVVASYTEDQLITSDPRQLLEIPSGYLFGNRSGRIYV